ncbi:4-azaleucine resistance transporter AzlC [Scopulibacillus daqui]|uniref:4-azaleucine resistance transporter AzlC n=1 Tax=Scopulibacillus daqui TaxID=1469162 RepID=A0ABS2Q4Z9_9BACL|nr:4-azaleucine resistance transporter AzlC [Scopulibacillus daqui]
MITNNQFVRTNENALTFKQGVKDCIPTWLGYISVGFAAGIVGVSSKLSIVEITLLSALVYAGASQFIICALLAAHSPAMAIILTTFIVNLRNFLLSATLAPHFTKYSLMKNLGIGIFVTDESFGLAMNKIAKGEKLNDHWMNGINVSSYIIWVLSCVIGAICGNWIPDPKVFGLDFAVTAMFAALLVLQLQTLESSKLKHDLFLMAYMVIAMIIFSFFVPSHLAVILSTLIVATIGVVTDQ